MNDATTAPPPEAVMTQLAESRQWLAEQGMPTVDVALILGSGLGDFADALPQAQAFPYEAIPHFPTVGVVGHAGRLVVSTYRPGFTVACLQGRFHLYEGHDAATVIYPTRLLRHLGARHLIVTNAAGGVNTAFQPGDLMVIEDHLNLMGINPLTGPNTEALGPRFPDLSTAYDPGLQGLAHAVAQREGIALQRGIYAGVHGPSYETPAEIRMLRTLGADAVGMSTVPEVIAANHMGLPVLGISCITNAAAGVSSQPLSHGEVMEAANAAKPRFMRLLDGILKDLAAD